MTTEAHGTPHNKEIRKWTQRTYAPDTHENIFFEKPK